MAKLGQLNKLGSKCFKLYHPLRLLPILTWIKSYKLSFILRDVIAGVTIGLMLIPQALAYAELAGLPAYYGLYSSFLGATSYTFLGTSKHVSLGPAAISSALTSTLIAWPAEWPTPAGVNGPSSPELCSVLSFLTGSILLLIGLLQLGWIVNFISGPTLTGFISAVAVVIPVEQMAKVFGLTIKEDFFVMKVYRLFEQVFSGNANWFDFAIGFSTMIMLVILKELKTRFGDAPKVILSTVIWFAGTAKAAVVVLTMMIVGLLATTPEEVTNFLAGCTVGTAGCPKFMLTTIENVGMASFFVPPFQFEYETCSNLTTGGLECEMFQVDFLMVIGALGTGLITMPIICFLQHISMVKAFARKDNYTIDPTQEFVALGAANMANGFVGGIPISSSMARCAVNYQANCATQISGLIGAGVVLLATVYLADLFVYVPSAALAGLIVVSASSLFNFDAIKQTWHKKNEDIIPLLATFLTCLYSTSSGIIVGIVVHVLMLLGEYLHPVNKLESGKDKSTLVLTGALVYPSTEALFWAIEKKSHDTEGLLILDFTNVTKIDSTAGEGIVEGLKFVAKSKVDFEYEFKNISPEQHHLLTLCGLPPGLKLLPNCTEF